MKESSRVVVKGLPKTMSDSRLKEYFSKKGYQVTDCRVQKTQNGQSRFKSEEQAKEVLTQYNGTFIESSKVTIEYAQAKNSEELSRAWSKHTPGSSAFLRANPIDYTKKSKDAVDKDAKDKKEKKIDAQLEEFLGVTLKKKGQRVWANDEVANEEETRQRDNKVNAEKGIKKSQAMKEAGIAPKKKERAAKNEDSDAEDEEFDSEEEDVVDMSNENTGMKALSFDSDEEDDEDEDAPKETSSSKKSASTRAEPEEEEDEEEDGVDEEEASAKDEKKVLSVEDSLYQAGETGRLRVLNLPYSATSDEIKAFFVKKFGPVEEAHVSKHEVSGKSRGFGFVQFVFPEHAVVALQQFYTSAGVVFQGRKIKLESALEKKSSLVDGVAKVGGRPALEKSSYKKEQAKKLKANAGNARTWNLLYVSANGVADAVAESLGVDKADLLDLDSEGLAVRVALGEAQLLRDTKEWLKKEGIRVDAFERRGTSLHSAADTDTNKARASDTLILKHLPAKVTDDDLRSVLAPFGSYSRLCVSPSRTVAIVQFAEAQRANSAFYGLAFKNFLGSPLYVEWAPVDLFNLSTKTNTANLAETKKAADKKAIAAADSSSSSSSDDSSSSSDESELEDAVTVSVYVKNLNFRTSETAFKNFFARLKGFKSAKLVTKQAPEGSNLPVDVLSMGYGFIEFDTLQNAKDCLKSHQGSALDGHSLVLSIAANRQAAQQKADNKEKVLNTTAAGSTAAKIDTARVGTRLLVKNLAFQTSKRDVQKLFTPYGTVASVRLPKKADGTCRGFGFVEMASRSDAKNALEMLQHAHLYGRHLVIEPAKEDDPADSAEQAVQRAEAALDRSAGTGPQNESRKRRKLAKLDEVEGGSMGGMMGL